MLLDVIEPSRANDITVSMATNVITMRESTRRKRRQSRKHQSPAPNREKDMGCGEGQKDPYINSFPATC